MELFLLLSFGRFGGKKVWMVKKNESLGFLVVFSDETLKSGENLRDIEIFQLTVSIFIALV